MAKAAIRGTADEYAQTEPGPATPDCLSFQRAASIGGDLCYSDSIDNRLHVYRVRRELHPRLYELREQDDELNRLRLTALHEEVAARLDGVGRKVLDEQAMTESWESILARSAQ